MHEIAVFHKHRANPGDGTVALFFDAHEWDPDIVRIGDRVAVSVAIGSANTATSESSVSGSPSASSNPLIDPNSICPICPSVVAVTCGAGPTGLVPTCILSAAPTAVVPINALRNCRRRITGLT